jgi:DNA polymerase sigma
MEQDDKMNVQLQDKGVHPILILQKDETNGVTRAVDISFNGHNEVHKSHEVDTLLEKYEGARGLALLVKMWMYSVDLKQTWPKPCLSSHAWMLLVIEYMHTSTETKRIEVSEECFFEWFLEQYSPDQPWSIGKRKPPFEFEADNVARLVQKAERALICKKVEEARQNIKARLVPWST